MVPGGVEDGRGALGTTAVAGPRRRGGTVLVVEPVPLIILAVVVGAAAVLLPYLVRLQRAARQALEAVRGMEAELESMRADQNGGGAAEGPPPPEDPTPA